MRLNNEVQFRRDTNFAAQTVRMTVDENNIQHIMSVLTDLYSDPMMAVIREYSTNALDSHIAAGNTDPIEVFLPGPFERTFRVVDKGVGLSVDDLVNIYSKYGYSTKRDNDNESGMLGLGCKAGLTYTDQFTLTAVKNGVKTVAIVARGEDGAGVIDIIDTTSTTEDNGVTISVPVRDSSVFNQRAKEFFRFWTPGTVKVDGQEPARIEGLHVSNALTVVPDGLSEDYVVMGNIGYGVGNRLSHRLPYGYNVVADVTMGDVNFTPNREALHYTPRTEKTIERIVSEVSEGVQTAAQREIDKAEDHHAAMMASQHWNRLTRNSRFTYKGEVIPSSFDKVEGFKYNLSAHRYATSSFRNYIDINTVNKALQVTGFENESVSATVRKKVRHYIQENDLNVSHVLFTKERIGDKWTEGLPSVNYSIIKAIRFKKAKGNGATAGEPIPFYVNGTRDKADIDQIPGTDKVVFSSAQELSGSQMSTLLPGTTLVELNRNRWDKFVRENTGTKTIDEALKEALTKIEASLTPREHMEISGTVRRVGSLKNLTASEIKDPELRALVESFNEGVDKERMVRYNQVKRSLSWLEIYTERPEGDVDAILKKYPLLEYAENVTAEHLTDYVNTFYEKENA